MPPTVVSAAPPAPVQSQPTPRPPTGVASPVFNILLAWGAGATDLDLHLTGPLSESVFHVYYSNPGSLTTQPYALLHADDLGTSGSEVITVQQFNQGGTYKVSVFNYGNQSTTSTNLSTSSGVSLKIINGGTVVATSGGGSTVQGGTLVASLTTTSGLVGNTWVAVYIDPATGEVTLVNQIINTTDGITTTASETAALTLSNLSAAPAATVAALAVVSTAPAATSAAGPFGGQHHPDCGSCGAQHGICGPCGGQHHPGCRHRCGPCGYQRLSCDQVNTVVPNGANLGILNGSPTGPAGSATVTPSQPAAQLRAGN